MSRYVCIIQEGQAADAKREALEAGLRRIGEECFGDDPAATEIQWRTVRPGFGFTAGEPSTSSLVIRSVPVGLAFDERERFLRRVCELFETVTGCDVDEVVVTAWDGPLPL
ncbi:MAG: hypothetical protein ABFS41_00970 [Myxococcota bacterium]